MTDGYLLFFPMGNAANAIYLWARCLALSLYLETFLPMIWRSAVIIQATALVIYAVLPHDILGGANWLLLIVTFIILSVYLYQEWQLIRLFWRYVQWPSPAKLRYRIERASGLSGFAYVQDMATDRIDKKDYDDKKNARILRPAEIFLKQRYQKFLQHQRDQTLSIKRRDLHPLTTADAQKKIKEAAPWLTALASQAVVAIIGGLSIFVWSQLWQEPKIGQYWRNVTEDIGLTTPPLAVSAIWIHDPLSGQNINLDTEAGAQAVLRYGSQLHLILNPADGLPVSPELFQEALEEIDLFLQLDSEMDQTSADLLTSALSLVSEGGISLTSEDQQEDTLSSLHLIVQFSEDDFDQMTLAETVQTESDIRHQGDRRYYIQVNSAKKLFSASEQQRWHLTYQFQSDQKETWTLRLKPNQQPQIRFLKPPHIGQNQDLVLTVEIQDDQPLTRLQLTWQDQYARNPAYLSGQLGLVFPEAAIAGKRQDDKQDLFIIQQEFRLSETQMPYAGLSLSFQLHGQDIFGAKVQTAPSLVTFPKRDTSSPLATQLETWRLDWLLGKLDMPELQKDIEIQIWQAQPASQGALAEKLINETIPAPIILGLAFLQNRLADAEGQAVAPLLSQMAISLEMSDADLFKADLEGLMTELSNALKARKSDAYIKNLLAQLKRAMTLYLAQLLHSPAPNDISGSEDISQADLNFDQYGADYEAYQAFLDKILTQIGQLSDLQAYQRAQNLLKILSGFLHKTRAAPAKRQHKQATDQIQKKGMAILHQISFLIKEIKRWDKIFLLGDKQMVKEDVISHYQDLLQDLGHWRTLLWPQEQMPAQKERTPKEILAKFQEGLTYIEASEDQFLKQKTDQALSYQYAALSSFVAILRKLDHGQSGHNLFKTLLSTEGGSTLQTRQKKGGGAGIGSTDPVSLPPQQVKDMYHLLQLIRQKAYDQQIPLDVQDYFRDLLQPAQ